MCWVCARAHRRRHGPGVLSNDPFRTPHAAPRRRARADRTLSSPGWWSSRGPLHRLPRRGAGRKDAAKDRQASSVPSLRSLNEGRQGPQSRHLPPYRRYLNTTDAWMPSSPMQARCAEGAHFDGRSSSWHQPQEDFSRFRRCLPLSRDLLTVVFAFSLVARRRSLDNVPLFPFIR